MSIEQNYRLTNNNITITDHRDPEKYTANLFKNYATTQNLYIFMFSRCSMTKKMYFAT
jgi:hypothetical protein